MTATADLRAVFQPRAIAVVGASRDPLSMSGTLLRNLRDSFPGPLYPVNPRAGTIDGLVAYRSVRELPGPVDLVFIAVPVDQAVEAAEQAVRAGARALVVITAGFGETGEDGRRRERQLLEVARRAGIPLVGPNCLGVLNTDPHCPLNGTFSLPRPPAGKVAVGTQSGALGFVFPDFMRRWRLGLSQLLSTGNKRGVGENDLLAHWRNDPATDVIMLYLESFQEPRAFMRLARRVGRVKPIVVLKSGRTRAGSRAAGSHTAALAGPAAVADGLLRQAGVLSCDSLEQLFDVTAVLATQPLPRGRRVAILTNAGGPGVLCSDALEAERMVVPEFSVELQAALRQGLPDAAGVGNPIDLIGSTDPGQFRHCLRELRGSQEMDAVVVIYVPRVPGTSAAIAEVLCEEAREEPRRTHLAVFMESAAAPEPLVAGDDRVPSFRYPEAAAHALAQAARRHEWLGRPAGRLMHFGSDVRQAALGVIERAKGAGPRSAEAGRAATAADGWLTPADSLSLVEAAGLPVPPWAVAHGEQNAARVARQFAGPVVLKALSPSVLHKSAAGGVALAIQGDRRVREHYRELLRAVPDMQGVLVQQFVAGGREWIVGTRRDPACGQLIGLGQGGVLVEQLRRISFRLAPLTDRDADDLIAEQLGGGQLGGGQLGGGQLGGGQLGGDAGSDLRDIHGGVPPLLRDALLRVSWLVREFPAIEEADLNPVKLLDQGRRLLVLDARFRLAVTSARKRSASTGRRGSLVR